MKCHLFKKFLFNIRLILSSYPLTGGTFNICCYWSPPSPGFAGVPGPIHHHSTVVIRLLWFPLKPSLCQPVWRLQLQRLCRFCTCLGSQAGPNASLPRGNTAMPVEASWHCSEKTIHLYTPHPASSLLSRASQAPLFFNGPHTYLFLLHHSYHMSSFVLVFYKRQEGKWLTSNFCLWP